MHSEGKRKLFFKGKLSLRGKNFPSEGISAQFSLGGKIFAPKDVLGYLHPTPSYFGTTQMNALGRGEGTTVRAR